MRAQAMAALSSMRPRSDRLLVRVRRRGDGGLFRLRLHFEDAALDGSTVDAALAATGSRSERAGLRVARRVDARVDAGWLQAIRLGDGSGVGVGKGRRGEQRAECKSNKGFHRTSDARKASVPGAA